MKLIIRSFIIFLSDEEARICDLTVAQRLRLCTVMLSAPMYREKIKYSSHKDGLKPECKKRELILTHGTRISFNDWVIECKVLDLENGKDCTYDVSLGIESEHVLLSRTVGNVSVISAHSYLHNHWT